MSKAKLTNIYKKAIFPWAIIYTMAILLSGITIGWVARSSEASYINNRAEAMVSNLNSDRK